MVWLTGRRSLEILEQSRLELRLISSMHSIVLSWQERSVRHDKVIQIYIGLRLSLVSLQVSLLSVAALALSPPHVVLLCGALGRVSSVGEVVEIVPVGRGGAVNVIIPVADSKLLVEAGLIGAHVGNPPAVLVTHVEYHAVEFQISVESDRSVGAVKIESDIGKVSPSLLLKLNMVEGSKNCRRSVIQQVLQSARLLNLQNIVKLFVWKHWNILSRKYFMLKIWTNWWED